MPTRTLSSRTSLRPAKRDRLLLSIPAELQASAARNRRAAGREHRRPKATEGVEARARKLEAYLRDSGQFSYTLQMDVNDRTSRPG